VAADEDGLARLVIKLGPEVRACLEMMSGAVWVRDRLAAVGWAVEVAHPFVVWPDLGSPLGAMPRRPGPSGRFFLCLWTRSEVSS